MKVSITKYITQKLKLKVNESKSRTCKGYELNFLGHSILKSGQIGLSKQSEQRLKDKVREVTKRSKGISLEEMLKQLRSKLQGWLNYFRYAKMSSKMEAIEGWIRRRLKCFRLKQCKRTIGIVRWLRKLGVEETLSWRTALSGKGWWRLSNSPAVNIGMNKMWFTQTTSPYIVNHFKETAVHASTYGGVRGRQSLVALPPTLIAPGSILVVFFLLPEMRLNKLRFCTANKRYELFGGRLLYIFSRSECFQ